MASPTWWTWVWVNTRSWWWTGRPGLLRFMGSQRVGHDWTTELNWTELKDIRVCSVVSDSLWLHGLQPSRLFCPQNFPGRNTGVGCHYLLQENFPTQIKPAFLVSLALAGGLFTTVPSGKSPKNTHFLIPRNYEYITLHGKGELQLQI